MNDELTKDQLIEKVEQLEQKIEELNEDKKDLSDANFSLRQEADSYSDYRHQSENKFEHVFYMGAKSGIKQENTLRAWLNFKLEL